MTARIITTMGKVGKRTRMKTFVLDEISLVDLPAQEGARIALRKHHTGLKKMRPALPVITEITPAIIGEIFAEQNAAVAKLKARLGITETAPPPASPTAIRKDSEVDFIQRVRSIMKAEGVDLNRAHSLARQRHPEEYGKAVKKIDAKPVEPSAQAARIVADRMRRAEVNAAISEEAEKHKKRNGRPDRLAAMKALHKSRPDLWQK